jgi:hypothetical protein
LALPDNRVDDGPRKFQPDADDIQKNLGDLKKQVRANNRLRITATFLGELRARRKITIVRNESSWHGNGYGQMGRYPAQLVIRTVVNPRVIGQSRLET